MEIYDKVSKHHELLNWNSETVKYYICEHPHIRPTANHSLLTANWTFTFSAKERDSETGLSYFGSRYYSSDLSVWLSVDPMSDKYASLSPYVYCADNPVRLVDPDGEDWVERVVHGQKEIYYDRSVKCQADVNRKYGEKSGLRHLADGTKVGNGKYTVYNDHVNNTAGVVKDSRGNVVNPDRTIIYGIGYRIFAGVTEESVDATSLHKNITGTSYTGPNNPKNYDGKDNYDYIPRNLSEIFSMIHDKQYDALGMAGTDGVFYHTETWKADLLLAGANAISVPFNLNPIDKARSTVTAVLFGLIGLSKMTVHTVKSMVKKTKDNEYTL